MEKVVWMLLGALTVCGTWTPAQSAKLDQATHEEAEELPPGLDRNHHVIRRAAKRKGYTVFYDDFTDPKLPKWQKDNMAIGLGHFQMYSPERAFVKNGQLWIQPEFTEKRLGKGIMEHGVVDSRYLWGYCWEGNVCKTNGTQNRPIISGSIRSKPTGKIRYGFMVVEAKMPKGDWIWPAIWMMPVDSVYGEWPKSGEIDLIETAGNRWLTDKDGKQMGLSVDQCHLHFGENAGWPAHQRPEGKVRLPKGTFGDSFHKYWLDWTKDYIKIGVDNSTCMQINTPKEGFWKSTNQKGRNIWAKGGKNAPFDQHFYLILNVAIAGEFFWNVPQWKLPWNYNAPDDYRQFWYYRWRQDKGERPWAWTWKGDDVAMKVKSVWMKQYT